MNRLDRDIQFLAEIHQKAFRIQNFEEMSLIEGRVSVLTEDVSKDDLAKLKGVINNFDEKLKELKQQIDKLTSKDSLPKDPNDMHPKVNQSATLIKKLIDDYEKALASLTKAYGNLSFEKGGFGLGAKFVTIPAMVTIITEMLEDATALVKGYEEFKEKILDVTEKIPDDKADSSIAGLNKSEDSSAPSSGAVIDAAKKSFGGKNALQKAISFLGKSIKTVGASMVGGAATGAKVGGAIGAGVGAVAGVAGGAALAGAGKWFANQKKEIQAIRSKVPQFDGAKTGEAFGILFISVKISALRDLPPPAAVPSVAPAQAAIQNAGASVGTQGQSAAAKSAPAQPTANLSANEINQLKALRDKLDPEIQKLIDPIIAAGPTKKSNKKTTTSAPAAPAAPAKVPESRTRNFLGDGQQLLTSRRHKIQENSENHDYDRWASLAGIK